MKLVNQDTGETIAMKVMQAHTFFRRLRGLLFTQQLSQGTGLHIKPCRSVHTYMMGYAIDVLHLDAHSRVVGFQEHLPPGRIGAAIKNTASVVELPAGCILRTRTAVGQTVQFLE
ncbi:MAG: hypothetical protein K0R75_2032 [Paenibacillaceae bacterium]|nr:hypothetical protein [Paenibacillaceae bacterium]